MMGATSSPKATFPAFSSAPKAAAASSHAPAPTIKKPESSSGMTVKLIHPDEDISLVRAVNTIDRVHVHVDGVNVCMYTLAKCMGFGGLYYSSVYSYIY